MISTKVGSYVTGDDIRNDLIAIYEMGYFQQEPIAKVPPYKNGIKIIYSVQENVVVDRIEITGNTLISDEEIQSGLRRKQERCSILGSLTLISTGIAQAYYEKKHSIGLKDISFDEQTRTLKVELESTELVKFGLSEMKKPKTMYSGGRLNQVGRFL